MYVQQLLVFSHGQFGFPYSSLSKIMQFTLFATFRFLIDKAKSDPDWDEAVPFEKKIRGKVYASDKKASDLPKNELSELGFDVDLDDGVTEVCFFLSYALVTTKICNTFDYFE